MEGGILGYEAGEGGINTADGARYKFIRSQWRSPREPVAGHKVDFVPQEDQATDLGDRENHQGGRCLAEGKAAP
jgi:hypothetical protein